MNLNGRIKRLEQQQPQAQDNGRIIWSFEFPDNDAWEAAKAEHRRRWPNHQGIRFIDDTSFRENLFPDGR